MEKLIKEYLNELKTKGNLTYSDVSNLSGIPEGTIRKIFSGDTPDPRFETVVKLVKSMGGSLEEIVSPKKTEEIEMNAIMALKESYEKLVAEIRTTHNEHTVTLKESNRFLRKSIFVLGAILILILVADAALGNHGWIRY